MFIPSSVLIAIILCMTLGDSLTKIAELIIIVAFRFIKGLVILPFQLLADLGKVPFKSIINPAFGLVIIMLAIACRG